MQVSLMRTKAFHHRQTTSTTIGQITALEAAVITTRTIVEITTATTRSTTLLPTAITEVGLAQKAGTRAQKGSPIADMIQIQRIRKKRMAIHVPETDQAIMAVSSLHSMVPSPHSMVLTGFLTVGTVTIDPNGAIAANTETTEATAEALTEAIARGEILRTTQDPIMVGDILLMETDDMKLHFVRTTAEVHHFSVETIAEKCHLVHRMSTVDLHQNVIMMMTGPVIMARRGIKQSIMHLRPNFRPLLVSIQIGQCRDITHHHPHLQVGQRDRLHLPGAQND